MIFLAPLVVWAGTSWRKYFFILGTCLLLYQQDFYLFPSSGGGPSPLRQTARRDLRTFLEQAHLDVQDFWTEQTYGYQPASLAVFSGGIMSPCGIAPRGPFYCRANRTVYAPLGYLTDQVHKHGDFAAVYILAHESAHHLAHSYGLAYPREAGSQGGSVKNELEADCRGGAFAGWAAKKGLMDAGDLEEARQAAYSVGNDTKMLEVYGRIYPEEFTHGTSRQRVAAFDRGRSGGPGSCRNMDTTRLSVAAAVF